MSNTGRAISPGAGTVKRRRGLLGFLIALTIVAGLVVFALAAAGVGYSILASRYDRAERAMDAGQYAKAMEHITNLPPWFEDADEMMVYIQGCAALAADDYFSAAHYFTMTGAFRDAEDRAVEANYLLGCWYLDKGDGNNAKKAFHEVLGKAEYSKSEMLRHTAYLAAVKLYDLGEPTATLGYFQDNRYYLESGKFLALIEAHQYTVDKGFNTTQALYERLVALDGFHDASELMGSDIFVYHYLVGQWESDHGFNYIKCTHHRGVLAEWTLDTNLPKPSLKFPAGGSYYKVKDGVMTLYEFSGKQSFPAFRIKVVSANEMTVFCEQNSTTYMMIRKQ